MAPLDPRPRLLFFNSLGLAAMDSVIVVVRLTVGVYFKKNNIENRSVSEHRWPATERNGKKNWDREGQYLNIAGQQQREIGINEKGQCQNTAGQQQGETQIRKEISVNTMQCNTIQYNTTQHSTAQHNTAQHNTTQYNTKHY